MSEILTSPRPSRFGRALGFRVLSSGSAVPDRVVTNADLGHLGCDPEWILSRSGIQERRHVDPGMATSDLAVKAAEQALAACGDVRDQVDLLVLDRKNHLLRCLHFLLLYLNWALLVQDLRIQNLIF